MTGSDAVRVAIAAGSNLGDRVEHLVRGVEQLRSLLRVEQVSRVVETPAEGDPTQGPYLNLVVVGRTFLSPHRLLEELLAIERSEGRVRRVRGEARTLDLDLILYGDRVLMDPELRVPHPRWRSRPFVALPLLEVLPDGRDPETGLPLARSLDPGVRDAPLRMVGPLPEPDPAARSGA